MNCISHVRTLEPINSKLQDYHQKTYTGSRAGHKDQTPQIRRTLVAERSGRVDQGADTVRLNRAADERRAPSGCGGGSLLRLEELLLGVSGLGPVVGVAKERGHDGERGGVVEDGAEGNGAGLDGWEVCGTGRLVGLSR